MLILYTLKDMNLLKLKFISSYVTGFLLCFYLLISLFIGLAHNHEPDMHFHDNCIACQWMRMEQDTDSKSVSIKDALHPVLDSEPVFYFYHIQTIKDQTILFRSLSRSPPVLF